MAKKFNQTFPQHSVDYPLNLRTYSWELDALAAICRSDRFPQYLRNMHDFAACLDEVGRDSVFRRQVCEMAASSPVIDLRENMQLLENAVNLAQLCACCDLLEKAHIPLSALTSVSGGMLAEALLAKYQHLGPGNEALGQLEAKMHCADAVKSIQLLRLSGLLTRPTTGIRQLSIGAGMAIKDLRAIHLYPEISMDDKGNLIFSVREDHPQDAVIVDGDPQWRKLYRDMNNCDQYKICACNEVSATALKKLPGKLRQREMGLRNAVFGLRIDHRMIPDAAAFFRQLVPVLDDSADLVITIGAGHGADDFAGRMKVLRELRDYLRNRGMMPVLLKMHGDGTPEEQRAGNYFGLMGHTTHEILYCSLEKASLAN